MLPEIPQQVILISAYDYHNLKIGGHITLQYIKELFKDKILFLDSGGYELQFSDSDDWTPLRYKQIIEELQPNFFVEYDRIPSYDNHSDTISLIGESVNFINNYDQGRVLLIHFSLKNNPQKEISSFANTLQEYSNHFDILGIPEREIGANVVQRAKFISCLRNELDKRGIVKPIHIFGCSDPVSMVLFVLAGADFFDGLGWIKYVFDRNNLRTCEKSQLPFLKCDCIACNNVNWNNVSLEEYEYRLLIHNLYAYDNFFFDLRDAIIHNETAKFIEKMGISTQIKEILEGF